MVAVGKGAGTGVLIKSAESLGRMEKVDTLVVDKTGTLTEGKPQVTAVVPTTGLTEADLLRLAASLERSSEHPLAATIVAAANGKGIAVGDLAGKADELRSSDATALFVGIDAVEADVLPATRTASPASCALTAKYWRWPATA